MMPLLLSYWWTFALHSCPRGCALREVLCRARTGKGGTGGTARLPPIERTCGAHTGRRKVLITAARISTLPAALLARRGPTRFVACASNAPISTRVSLPARSARTRAWSKPGFAAPGGAIAPVENFPRRVVDKTNLNLRLVFLSPTRAASATDADSLRV